MWGCEGNVGWEGDVGMGGEMWGCEGKNVELWRSNTPVIKSTNEKLVQMKAS